MRAARALVLAAGLGTRLRPVTDRVPKCLIPIAGRPILDYWLTALADAGIREITINTHHLPDQVRRHIAAVNRRGGQRIVEAYEPELLGSAGTVTAARALADGADEILIVYADNFSDVDVAGLVDFHRSHGDPVTMLLFRAADPRACGIVSLDGDSRVVGFTEKPRHPTSDLANAGVYVVSAEAHREMADARGFDLGRDVLPGFVGRMRGWLHQGYHVDVGTTEALARVQADAPRVNALRLMGPDGSRPAVFLDRDGVLIEHVPYIADPDAVRLVPGAAAAIVALRRAGYACVVVSNQSGIGRGLITPSQYEAVSERMRILFASEGAVFDALYHCPAVPAVSDPTIVEHHDRKPGPGMLLQAAGDLHLDLPRSWMVGDTISDVLAGVNAGCGASVLTESALTPAASDRYRAIPHRRARDLASAARLIVECRTAAPMASV
jgi:mannose-1-phosphate guanylyltransferase